MFDPFSFSKKCCYYFVLVFATRRLLSDIRLVAKPMKLPNGSYTADDHILIYRLSLMTTFQFNV